MAQLAKTDPNWPYSRLTKKTGWEAGLLGGGNCLCRICSLYPPSLHLLCLYLNPLCSHSLLHPLEGGRKQLGIRLLTRVSPGKLYNLGNFLYFFSNIHSVCRRKCSHRLTVLKFRNTTMFVSRSTFLQFC